MNENKEKPVRETWKVSKVPTKPAESGGWLDVLRRRREPSTYQRCLAVHIHFAGPRGGLT